MTEAEQLAALVATPEHRAITAEMEAQWRAMPWWYRASWHTLWWLDEPPDGWHCLGWRYWRWWLWRRWR